jgi:hypothetical protein
MNRRTQAREMIAEGFIMAGDVLEMEEQGIYRRLCQVFIWLSKYVLGTPQPVQARGVS